MKWVWTPGQRAAGLSRTEAARDWGHSKRRWADGVKRHSMKFKYNVLCRTTQHLMGNNSQYKLTTERKKRWNVSCPDFNYQLNKTPSTFRNKGFWVKKKKVPSALEFLLDLSAGHSDLMLRLSTATSTKTARQNWPHHALDYQSISKTNIHIQTSDTRTLNHHSEKICSFCWL